MHAIQQEPIALIGMGCRFPQAHNPQEFWTLLCEGKDAICEVPADRWDIEKIYNSDAALPGKTASRWGGFLDQVDQFDWRAFRLPPNEATSMDPQHRLLLEVAWEALEDAGLPLEEVAGSQTSVSIGIGWSDYLRLQARNWSQLDEHTAMGNANGSAANRLSYVFDLKGPSVSVDCSCASSLTAVYLACQSLWTGEASLALAGGVSLMLSPESMIMQSKSRLLSGEGRCKTLDAHADGYVRGEGAGILVLKPLSQVKQSDRVYTLIRGIAFNHNGHNTWITAPSQTAQEALLRDAYHKAGVSPWQIDYVELNGTGFRRGDAIEAKALGAVLGAGPERIHPCLIGSVKTNIGHLEAASGIASVIKVALSLYHREIPSTLNLQTINPDIPLDDLHLAVPQTSMPWPEKAGVPIAGVTTLSFSGANAHAVLSAHSSTVDETSLEDDEGDKQQVYRLLPLSALSEQALYGLAKAYEDFLQTQVSNTESSWRDICYSASVCRTHHRHRLAVLGRTPQEAAEALCFSIQKQFSSDNIQENNSERQNEIPAYLANLKRLYTSGHEVNWSELYREEECHCVSLPVYCWQRERLWPDWLDVEEISTPPEQRGSMLPSVSDSPTQLAATALENKQSVLNQLRLALPQERPEILRTALTKQAQELLGLDAKQSFGPQQGLFELGMDSLTATRFVNQLQVQLGCSLSPILLFSYPTIESLVNYLLKDVLGLLVLEPAITHEFVQTPQQSESHRSVVSDFENLSDTDIEALLAYKLNAIEAGTLLRETIE
jgi:3-oxoacyl-[acyl-carrier-protein] synthase II